MSVEKDIEIEYSVERENAEESEDLPTKTNENNCYSTLSTISRQLNFELLPPPDKWPNHPIMIRKSPLMAPKPIIEQSSYGQLHPDLVEYCKPIRIHNALPEVSIISLNSEHFVGQAFAKIAGLQDSPSNYFRGKQRTFEVVIQGRFLHKVPFASVYMGQAFEWALEMTPPLWLSNALMPVIHTLQPALQMNLHGDKPYILSPLMATMQHVVVSKPGEEPSLIKGWENFKDDLNLVDAEIFSNMSSVDRKAYFSKRENLNKYEFQPDFVYTFDFYQHVLHLSTFMIHYWFLEYDILNILGKRSVQNMAVLWNPEEDSNDREESTENQRKNSWDYLYNIEIWHERCLKH